MSQYNTGNSVPSSDMRDAWDNNATLDNFLNNNELTVTTRTGIERDSLAGIQKKAEDQREQIAVDGAAVVEDTRQNLIPLSRQYMTLADAQADIANIPEGSTTYYRSPDDSALAIEVINNEGVLSPTGRSMPSQMVVASVVQQANATDLRTDGLRTSAESAYPYEVLDNEGKLAFYLDENGGTNMPGGANSPEIYAGTLFSPNLSAVKESGDQFDVAEVDRNGRVFFATDLARGIKIYLGEPLHNHRGPLPGDFFAIGDSITAYGVAHSGANADGSSYAPCVRDQSWHAWASLFTNGRLRLAGISATGGYTVTQILNVHVPVAVQAGSTFCVVMGGRNDIVQGINLDSVTIPAFIQIFRTLRRAGIIPVVCTMSAQGNSSSNSRRVAEHKLNGWLRGYARRYSLPLVDLHRYTVNPLTGDWLPGLNQDVSHPTGAGAKIMGKALVAGMESWTAPVWPARADEQIATGLSLNQIPNPLFLNNDGNNPDGWTITQAGVSAVAPDSSVSGNFWSMTNQKAYLTLAVTPGDRLQFGLMLKKEGSSGFACYLVSGDSSSENYLAGIRDWKESIDDFAYFSYELTVPNNVNSVTVNISAGASQLSIAQLSLIKLTEV
ncbi:SGNH/GDSL hydrolase family protein [Klebsiella aerogenes]|uniref:SGNH/GDSL hydrolase family protein n=1 Tax=Klebsiella aerogenes TaxID=548 RepID=UPI00301C3303